MIDDDINNTLVGNELPKSRYIINFDYLVYRKGKIDANFYKCIICIMFDYIYNMVIVVNWFSNL